MDAMLNALAHAPAADEPAAIDDLRALDDETLFGACRNGHELSFRVLVERHAGLLRRLAFNILADEQESEDVAQEAFIAAWRSREAWRPDAKFTTWLYRIAVNKAIDRYRASRAKPESDETINRLTDAAVDVQAAPDQHLNLERKDVSKRLQQALDRLPGRQRQALMLFYFQDYDVAKIAAEMVTSEQSVRAFLKRGKQALKINLGKQKKICDHEYLSLQGSA